MQADAKVFCTTRVRSVAASEVFCQSISVLVRLGLWPTRQFLMWTIVKYCTQTRYRYSEFGWFILTVSSQSARCMLRTLSESYVFEGQERQSSAWWAMIAVNRWHGDAEKSNPIVARSWVAGFEDVAGSAERLLPPKMWSWSQWMPLLAGNVVSDSLRGWPSVREGCYFG